MKKRSQTLLLCTLSGFLLWASWPVSPFTFLIFIAFVPFLALEHAVKSRAKFFWSTYLTMLIWNITTTWWICNSTVPGGVAAIMANSLLMCVPWMASYTIKRRLGENWGYLAMVVFWLSFEYIHLNWQLSWPWLTLGNVFASHPGWVQWYEFTGTSGGSLWILVTNILIFKALRKQQGRLPGFNYSLFFLPFLLIAIPLILSFLISLAISKPATTSGSVVVVQPNIDPYAKFEAATQEGQLKILISLSESRIDSATSLVVWPETAINYVSGIEESGLINNTFMQPVWELLKKHPRLSLLTGIEGYQTFAAENKTSNSRKVPGTEEYYNTYNTAALLRQGEVLQLYHKSKFVPGVETLPPFLRFLDTWFEQFGGTSGGYVPQEERTVMTDAQSGYRIAPAICYESIYGEFLTGYMRNGANVIAIITNDGWWDNTSGHKQLMNYARLRAIETRKWIIRSANTGISCFISPAGAIFDSRAWNRAAAIKREIPQLDGMTFYARFGDIISKAGIIISVFLLVLTPCLWLRDKVAKKNKNG